MNAGSSGRNETKSEEPLPDYYGTVAEDILDFCGRTGTRVWVDLGSGPGPVGFSILDRMADSVMVFVDPNGDALQRALERAAERGYLGSVVAIEAQAESIPMPDASVDVVVSRGSFFFWSDRARGLREVMRILRPGGKAMIGGGLGTRYPAWARREFIRRQRRSGTPGCGRASREFAEVRSPETFRRLAHEADLNEFDVRGEGGLGPDDPATGIGIWLTFTKEDTVGN